MISFCSETGIRYLHQTAYRLARKPCPTPGTRHLPKDGSYKIWKYLALLVGLPAIAGAGINCYQLKSAREEKGCERPPFVNYEALRRRTKRFPWGEGNKSLFHNPKVNPLPDGYEEEKEPAADE